MSSAVAVVVTCEHASRRIPPGLGDLGLPAAVLRSHRAFDVGAAAVARTLARTLRAPLHLGSWSRLVADLNRSQDHPFVVPRRVDGRVIAGNALAPVERRRRLSTFWAPYRDHAERQIRALAATRTVLHLSVHTFVERLNGIERRNHIGLLHDPNRPREVGLCEAMKAQLAAEGFAVRRNFPYFGNTDGFTSHLRRCLAARSYLGLEIECNQRLARSAAGQRRLAAALCKSVRSWLHSRRAASRR